LSLVQGRGLGTTLLGLESEKKIGSKAKVAVAERVQDTSGTRAVAPLDVSTD
jgi:hypothetical protein